MTNIFSFKKIATFILLFVASLSIISCGNDDQTNNNSIEVAATIFPVYSIAEQIAGDNIKVNLLIQPGESPHTFTPSVSTKQITERVNRVYVVEDDFDKAIIDIIDSKSKTLEINTNIDLLKYEDEHDDHDDHGDHDDEKHKDDDDHDDEHEDEQCHHEDDHDDDKHKDDDHDDDKHKDDDDHDDDKHKDDDDHDDDKHKDDDHDDDKHKDDDDHDDEHADEDCDHDGHDDHDDHGDDHDGHAHGEYDPHYWLSPYNAIQIARNIADDMKALDPNNSSDYEANYDTFKKSITDLNAKLKADVSVVSDVGFVTMHSAWSYFNEAFETNLVGSFEPVGAESPSPKYLAELQETIDEKNAVAIFSEPQLSLNSIQQFIQDNDLRTGVLDPLGGVDGRMTYQELLEYNISELVKTLR